MQCPKCQAQVADDAQFCPVCGSAVRSVAAAVPPLAAAVPPAQAPVTVNTWLIPSILVTLCCCLPLGIVSIVFAAKANSCVGQGDLAGAQDAAAKAKMWFWIALVCGFFASIIWVALQILVAVAEHAD